MTYYGHIDPPPRRCEHCSSRQHDSEDCGDRPAACEGCGSIHARSDLFWSGDDLIGDCCDPEALS